MTLSCCLWPRGRQKQTQVGTDRPLASIKPSDGIFDIIRDLLVSSLSSGDRDTIDALFGIHGPSCFGGHRLYPWRAAVGQQQGRRDIIRHRLELLLKSQSIDMNRRAPHVPYEDATSPSPLASRQAETLNFSVASMCTRSCVIGLIMPSKSFPTLIHACGTHLPFLLFLYPCSASDSARIIGCFHPPDHPYPPLSLTMANMRGTPCDVQNLEVFVRALHPLWPDPSLRFNVSQVVRTLALFPLLPQQRRCRRYNSHRQ
jgi:hypothetical protein